MSIGEGGSEGEVIPLDAYKPPITPESLHFTNALGIDLQKLENLERGINFIRFGDATANLTTDLHVPAKVTPFMMSKSPWR